MTNDSYQRLNSYTITMLSRIQSGPQDQKSVIFSHRVISLNQLLQISKNTANMKPCQNNSPSEYYA